MMIGNDQDIIARSHQIRFEVFVDEQSIPQLLDHDGLDEHSEHIIVLVDEKTVATARLSRQQDDHAVMARIAVSKAFRGRGIADKMIRALLVHAKKSGLRTIEIHAHHYLQHYYEKFGFNYIRDVEIVGDHQLVEMALVLEAYV